MNQNLGISLADYQNGSLDNQVLFDQAATSPEQLAELSKALEAGQITGRETTDSTSASGSSLKTESLEKNLKLITFKDSDIRFWKMIPKAPAFNTVEEYNQLTSYGVERGGFNNEGELPNEEDSTYVRRAQLVKFLGVTKSVTHPMQLVSTHIGPIMQRETTNGINWILRKADKGLFSANSAIIPQEWNGIYTQHASNDAFSTLNQYQDSEVVVDLRGKRLTEDFIETAAEGIIRNFGYGNLLMAPPIVLSNFVKTFHDSKLIQPNTPQVTAGVMGQRVKTFQSQYGEIALEYDIFAAKNGPRYTTSTATSTQAPTAPTYSTNSTPAHALSRFVTADAGDYFYAMSAVNRYGESAPTPATSSAITVAAGDGTLLTFTAGAGGVPATGYVVYRSKINPATTQATTPLYPLFSVSAAQLAAGFDGGAAGIVQDNNRWLPGCEEALMIQNDNEVYEFKQLAPLMKMDLAVLSPANRFMILLYGTPLLYSPKKMVRFINIGTAA